MPSVIPVRLPYNPKQYWFDPAGCEPVEGDHVIVKTDRGTEVGLVSGKPVEMAEKNLPQSLKPVVRVANEDDLAKIDELDERGMKEMPVFQELVRKHNLDMKPVRIVYQFDESKAIFYFSSEERIDFREIVRDLSARLHVRIDMRQIGVRDEARVIGGISHCGQELCCARMGGDFQPVSIRMAKEQDLPLNPVKISGLCGRLMCCLRYEFEAYKDFKSRAPKRNALIETPMGVGKVINLDTPLEIITLRMEDGTQVKIPLGDMTCSKECNPDGSPCKRPDCVSAEVMEACLHPQNTTVGLFGEVDTSTLDTSLLTDEVAEKGARPKSRKGRKSGSGSGSGKPQNAGDKQAVAKKDGEGGGKPRKRRRRGGKGGSNNGGSNGANNNAGNNTGGKGSSGSGNRPRPGQNSSGVRGGSQATSDAPRRKPRRRHPAQGSSDKGGAKE